MHFRQNNIRDGEKENRMTHSLFLTYSPLLDRVVIKLSWVSLHYVELTKNMAMIPKSSLHANWESNTSFWQSPPWVGRDLSPPSVNDLVRWWESQHFTAHSSTKRFQIFTFADRHKYWQRGLNFYDYSKPKKVCFKAKGGEKLLHTINFRTSTKAVKDFLLSRENFDHISCFLEKSGPEEKRQQLACPD